MLTFTGGQPLSKMSTLHLADTARVNAEIFARQLTCEVPECKGRAVTMIAARFCIVICERHRDAFLSSPTIAKAILSSIRVWIKFQVEDIHRYAYEGQEDDPDVLLVVGDDSLDQPDSLLDQARRILDGADKIASQMQRVVAASNSAPVMIFQVVEAPKVRPSISTLAPSNVHPGMQLFG